MKLQKFVDEVKETASEILSSEGNNTLQSHNLQATLNIYHKDKYFKVKRIKWDYLLGCQCPSGIEIELEEIQDD